MASFKDKQGREWIIEVSLPLNRSLKPHGIDLLNRQTDPFSNLASDPLHLVAVLWSICGKQADAEQIDKEDFEGAFGGNEFDSALRAMKAGVVEFYPPSKRAAVQEQLDQLDQNHADGEEEAIA